MVGSSDIQFHSTFLLPDLVGSIFLFISFVHEISLKYKLHQSKHYCLALEHRFHFLRNTKGILASTLLKFQNRLCSFFVLRSCVR